MTKRDQKFFIEINKEGAFKQVYYMDIYCGTYTKTFKDSEIKEMVYQDLKERGLLMFQ